MNSYSAHQKADSVYRLATAQRTSLRLQSCSSFSLHGSEKEEEKKKKVPNSPRTVSYICTFHQSADTDWCRLTFLDHKRFRLRDATVVEWIERGAGGARVRIQAGTTAFTSRPQKGFLFLKFKNWTKRHLKFVQKKPFKTFFKDSSEESLDLETSPGFLLWFFEI